MAITEKVTEKVSELKSDLRETVENLKEEVSDLKGKLVQLMPGRRGSSRVPARREARDALTQWRRETDRLFEEMWHGFGRPFGFEPMETGMEWPRIDVEDRRNEIRITAEIPGIDEEDLDVTLDEDRLTIRGEKRAERRDRREGGYHRSECFYGSFERTIALPAGIDRDNVDARFRKGVLTLRLPRTAEARERTRRIPVHSS